MLVCKKLGHSRLLNKHTLQKTKNFQSLISRFFQFTDTQKKHYLRVWKKKAKKLSFTGLDLPENGTVSTGNFFIIANYSLIFYVHLNFLSNPLRTIILFFGMWIVLTLPGLYGEINNNWPIVMWKGRDIGMPHIRHLKHQCSAQKLLQLLQVYWCYTVANIKIIYLTGLEDMVRSVKDLPNVRVQPLPEFAVQT